MHLTTRTEQAKAKLDTLPALIREIELGDAPRKWKLSVLAWDMQSLQGRITASIGRASTAEVRACQTLEKKSKHQTFVKGLKQTIRCKRACVATLVDAELTGV